MLDPIIRNKLLKRSPNFIEKYYFLVKLLTAKYRWQKYLRYQYHHHHFWQAPLKVRSAERRLQSPEWTVLSQINCIVHIEVAGFQILLYGFHPSNMRTSQWSPVWYYISKPLC